MVAVESPEWLPPGFTVKSKRNIDGKKIKYYFNVATGKKYYSKKKVIQCASEDNSLLVTPKIKNGDDKGSSSIGKVNAVSDNTNDSAEWLPNGWTVEQRIPMSSKAYKIYTDLSSGRKFYSKVAVTRYLSTKHHAGTISKQNKIDNEDQPLLDISSNVLPDTSTGNIRGKKRKANSLAKIENVDEPVSEKSLQIISMADAGRVPSQQTKGDLLAMVISTTNTDVVHGKKMGNSFVTVSVERTTPDDLPSGWIKEVRTSKRGKNMRTDPYYIDPVSGYMFCSKPDVLRYLETNDIHKCKKKPRKRDLEDIMLIDNKIPSSNLANEKLSMHMKQPFSGEEPNGGVESAGTKSPTEQESMILKLEQANHESIQIFEEAVSCETSKKEAEMGKTPNLEREPSENDTRVEVVDVAIGSPITNPLTKNQFPESESRNKRRSRKSKKIKGNRPESESEPSKNGTRVVAVDVAINSPVIDPSTGQHYPESGGRNKWGSRKPKKETCSSLPLWTSKRLACSVPEMKSNLEFDERPIRATLRGSIGSKVDKSPSFPIEASDSIPQTSNIEPVKEAVDHVVIDEETCNDVIQLNVVEKPHTESSAVPEEPSCDVAAGSPIIDPSIEQHYAESGGRNKRGSRKPKKETSSSLPVRTSKRFARSVPEMQSKLELNERPIRGVRGSIGSKVDKSPSFLLDASDSIPQTSNIEPTKEPSCEKATVKPLDEDQRPQKSDLSYYFRDSWSYPLEFVLKTPHEEIVIEKTPTCLKEKLNTTCLKESPSIAPVNIQSKLASESNSSNKNNVVDPLPASSPSVSAIGNTASSSFSGFNYQPNSVYSRKQNAVDLFPASSLAVSATETTGSSSFSTFNYRPNSESSEKHDAIDLLPARSPSSSVLGSNTFSSFSCFNYEQKSESLKAQNAVDLLPASSPSVSAINGTTGFNYQPNSASSKKHTADGLFPSSSPCVSPIGTTSFSSFSGFNYQPNSESSKKHHAVDPLPASSPSVSAIETTGFSSFSGFNYLQNSESSKKHNAVDPSPANSPSVSAIETTGFSSFSSFNYQLKFESSKKHNDVDLSPAISPAVSAIGTTGFGSFSGFNYQPTSESSKKHNAFSAIGTTGFNYQPNPESSGKQNVVDPLRARSPSVSALGASIFSSFRGFNYQPNSESSEEHNAFDLLPARSPSISALGSTGFSSFRGFNYQPESEASEKHNVVDLFPVGSPSVSATGRMGFSSFRGFNYQPKSESSQKHNAFDLLPAISTSISDIGNTSFSSFSNLNYQPKHEASKRHNFVDPSASGLGDTCFNSFSSFNYQPKHESSKTRHVIDLFPASSSSVSALGNPDISSFSSFNYQPVSESSKKHNSIDPFPANPPSSSSPGDLGFGFYSGFNYQPRNKYGNKASQSKFNP